MFLKKIATAILTFDDGTEHPVSYLGKGMTHDAWVNKRHVYLVSRTVKGVEDYSKEILTGHTYPLHSKHIPKVRLLGELPGDHRVYQMPLYEKLTARHKEAWKQQRFINEARREAMREHPGPSMTTGTDFAYEIVTKVTPVYKSLGLALEQLTDAMCNYGSHYTFEFNISNLSVKGETLILRDVIYSVECCNARWHKPDWQHHMRGGR